MTLDGRTALVTGAARGIGLAIALPVTEGPALLPLSRGAQSLSRFGNATDVIAARAPGVRLRRHAV